MARVLWHLALGRGLNLLRKLEREIATRVYFKTSFFEGSGYDFIYYCWDLAILFVNVLITLGEIGH